MIPSLVNLVIGGTSLVRGLPGVPSLLLRYIPERGQPHQGRGPSRNALEPGDGRHYPWPAVPRCEKGCRRTECSGCVRSGNEVPPAPPDRRLPMRDDPLRGHGACAARHMDLQRPKARPGNARCAPRPSQNVGRHSLAAPDSAFLDPQRAALGRIAGRGSEVSRRNRRTSPGCEPARREPVEICRRLNYGITGYSWHVIRPSYCPRGTGGKADRRERSALNQALAKALTFRDAAKLQEAREWAVELVRQLKSHDH